MNDLFINYYEIRKPDFVGIYVFFTAEEHKQDAPVSKDNKDCLCWMIFPARTLSFLKLHPGIDNLCRLEMIRFKTEAAANIHHLSQKVSQNVVDLMIKRVEIFINETIRNKVFATKFITPN